MEDTYKELKQKSEDNIVNLEKRLLYNNLIYATETLDSSEISNPRKIIPKYPLLILTCMDPEIDVYKIFHLNSGDAIILRNAGNVYSEDVKRSILIAIHVYNIKKIFVLGHAGCSLTGLNMTKINEKLLPLFFNAFWKNQDNPMKGFRKYFRVFIDELRNVRDQILSLKTHLRLSHEIEYIPLFYDFKSKLIFNLDELNGLKFINDFDSNYDDLINRRRGKQFTQVEIENPRNREQENIRKQEITQLKKSDIKFQEEEEYDNFIDNYIKKFNTDVKKLQNPALPKKLEIPLFQKQIYKKTRTIDQIKSELALEGYKRMINNYLGDCNKQIEENYNKLLAYAKSNNIKIEGFNDFKATDVIPNESLSENKMRKAKMCENKVFNENFLGEKENELNKIVKISNFHIYLFKTQLNFPKIHIPKINVPKFIFNNKTKKIGVKNE